ncbi:MAG: hypothetical protein D6737_09120 [Chloroflexi bacterium]|nr:MAG: hypothetical protein D6737_09120 [Chloroflexota bacterium]
MHNRRWIPIFILFVLFVAGFAPPQQQGLTSLLEISAEAGYDGLFRENAWLPVLIEVSNQGDDITGRLVIRPETSGNAVNNTYSIPIDMPNGARKSAFLYITARSSANTLRVEFIEDSGLIAASREVNVRHVQPQDLIYTVVTQAASGAVDLSGVQFGSNQTFQAIWQPGNIPDRPGALEAIDLMLFSDVDTATLASTQQQALSDWVLQGGHLIVTGGVNWQGTAAAFEEILPFQPDGSDTIGDITPLAEWAGIYNAPLDEETIYATGTVQPDGRVLVATEDDIPLLVRRTYGGGVIDYLTVDPNVNPLRGWDGMTDVWVAITTTIDPQPSWSFGFINWDNAAESVEILPGFSLLPSVLPLFGFLAAYILLVGPINYIVLNAINRREFAWVTIPLLIIVFSVIAWVAGFNLRGNEATLNRVSVVQSWPDSNRAHVDTLVGLLSPRRSQYSLAVTDDSLLQPIPRDVQGSLLTGNVRVSTDIEQTNNFSAKDFSVDASFIAGFHANGFVEAPPISGQATLFYNSQADSLAVRGSVRNDTAQTLTDAVILARGVSFQLDGPLEPGDVVSFDLILANQQEPPMPARVIDSPQPFTTTFTGFSFATRQAPPRTIVDIMGPERFSNSQFNQLLGSSEEDQRNRQRQLFLSSFLLDRYNSTKRGNAVYFAGWAEAAPIDFVLEGANSTTNDMTLYLVELDVEQQRPLGNVTITPDQFMWVLRHSTRQIDYSPLSLQLDDDEEVIMRFIPIESAVLAEVDELRIRMDRNAVRILPLELWNWEDQEWELFEINDRDETITEPDRFLGPQNAVELRIATGNVAGFLQVNRLVVEQHGSY